MLADRLFQLHLDLQLLELNIFNLAVQPRVQNSRYQEHQSCDARYVAYHCIKVVYENKHWNCSDGNFGCGLFDHLASFRPT